jgi:hypothetical protein
MKKTNEAALARWLENLNKKTRIHYPYDNNIEGIKKLKEIDKSARFGWVGAFSVSSRWAKVYNISEPVITWEGVHLVGTEIAKLLLLLNNPPKGYRKITAQQLEETPPPLYANPSSFEGVYLDIKSCYYSLICKLYGVKYARGLWLGRDLEIPEWQVPGEFEDILREFKEVRNAIYGIMRAKVRVMWKAENGKITFSVQNTRNELFYPDVPLAIMDITHAISTVAVEKFQARYVAIDGFILPLSQAENFKEWLEELGFKVGVKANGEAIIKNFYTYKVGKHATKHFHVIPQAKETQSNLLFDLQTAQEIIRKFKPFLTQK